jgi:hypothetical protein
MTFRPFSENSRSWEHTENKGPDEAILLKRSWEHAEKKQVIRIRGNKTNCPQEAASLYIFDAAKKLVRNPG